MSRNCSLYHIDQTTLTSIVLASFGQSFKSAYDIERGIRSIIKQDGPTHGSLGKIVFDNVNNCLTKHNLSRVSFETLKPVLYNMVNLRAGYTATSTAHERFHIFKKLVNKRFEVKPTPQPGIMDVEVKPVEVKSEPVVNTKQLVDDLMLLGFSLVEAVERVKSM